MGGFYLEDNKVTSLIPYILPQDEPSRKAFADVQDPLPANYSWM